MTSIAHYDHENLDLRSFAIEKLVHHFDDMEIYFTANSVRAVITYCQQHSPDILLFSTSRIEETAKKALESLTVIKGKAKIVLLTNKVSKWVIPNLRKLGINGYIVMAANPFCFVQCVENLKTDKLYCCPEVSSVMLGMYGETALEFSERERDVIKLLVADLSSKEIAAYLNVSPHTVDFHRRAILKKFNVKRTTGIIRRAIELGLA